MTITRCLPAVVLVAVAAGPAEAQTGPGGPGMGQVAATGLPGPARFGGATGIPGSAAAPAATPDPAITLNPTPQAYEPAAVLPPGSYAGPYSGGCCGPLGGNGPLTYELYSFTGPNLVSGSQLSHTLRTGWTVGAGTRSLLFNPSADAAWVLDLGIGYTYNRGDAQTRVNVVDRGGFTTNAFGQQVARAPVLGEYVVRSLHRSSFNFAVGRDCWAWGPGAAPAETGWNVRAGIDVGGRYGTAHADLIPTNDLANGYLRRQSVFHSLVGGAHVNVEVPVGGWILFGGVRAEYARDWMNVIPPGDGDLRNVNLLLTSGFRF